MRKDFERDGFCLLPAIDPTVLARIDALTHSVDPDDRRGGLREPQWKISGLSELVEHTGMHTHASQLLQADAQPVRWILFDKTSNANWLVPWHRDSTVCVSASVEVDGFGPWSIKDGRIHVQPPLDVLRGMVTLRLHIDAADETNGALQVIPGSHCCDRIDEEAGGFGAVLVRANAGEIFAMKPLLLHASSKGTHPSRRRVLHIEYASGPLPPPLLWN